MRLFSPLCVLLFLVVWTVIFLIIARYFLYSAHQSWFESEEKKLLASVEFKIDNLDDRNMRQLNQLYSEIKKLEEILSSRREERSVNSQSVSQNVDQKLEPAIGVLVIACDRVDYITRTLDTLLKYRPSAGLFPIIVSQDCGHQPTADAIAKYGGRITHIKHPDLSDVEIPASERKMKNKKSEVGYFKIARHYKWALGQVFEEMNYEYVTIVEDDLLIAPDFYSYFSALQPLLASDPTLMCVSAWNDNGKSGYINPQQNDLLYRTDFFPGLGWMMTKKLWLELKPKWPTKFWDDWMREPEQRKDRACIRPEVSRTVTIGKKGTSGSTYWTQHLQFIVLNSAPVDFMKRNFTYLKKDVYDLEFVAHIYQLPLVGLQDVLGDSSKEKEVRLQYSTNKEFETIAKRLKIMSDLRGGVPRTAYKGIVSFMYKNRRVHLTPRTPWAGYIK